MIEFSTDILSASAEHDIAKNGLKRRKLLQPVTVTIWGRGLCMIHETFVSDALSVPKWLRWLWKDNWTPAYANAAVLHDFLLKFSDRPKWEIDWMFYAALRSEGVGWFTSKLFYLAARSRRNRVVVKPTVP